MYLFLFNNEIWLCATQGLTTRYLSSFFVSSLEEDPLYIAYAEMMAKVLHSLHCFESVVCRSAKSCRSVILFSLSELCWRWRRGRWGRKGENIWGAIDFSGQLFCISLRFLIVLRNVAYTVLSFHPGKGNGEAKDAVPASKTTRSRSCRDGASNDQCQQRWETF